MSILRFNIDDIPVAAILADFGAADSFVQRALREGLSSIADEDLQLGLRRSKIVESNTNALALFEATERRGMDDVGCFRDEFFAFSRAFVEALTTKGQTPWLESVVYTLSGEAVPVLICARWVPGGNGNLLLWSFSDIRHLKAAEAEAQRARILAEDANESKSSFLAVMSHEIRTPLNGILGMAQLLLQRDLREDVRELVSIMDESGGAMLAILNDILDLAKIEAGRMDLELVDFDLTEVIKGAHNAFTAIAQKRGLSFALAIDATARGRYRGDPTRLRQILYNLISNALKFTSEGEVKVEARREGDNLVIAVRDTGIGIPAAKRAILFEKYKQADSSTSRKYGGTGLGLSICQDLAHLMGGRVTIESREGFGSTFSLTAPIPRLGDALAGSAAARSRQAPLPVLHGGDDGRSPRILIAEDNAVNQLMLRGTMLAIGADATIVGNGRLALAALETGTFDLVLMDVQMPEMDGLEAVREVRSRERGTGRRIPVIALTANAMPHQCAQYRKAGMDDHVEKPIELNALVQAIERALAAGRPLAAVASRD